MWGFPGTSACKESTSSAGDPSLIPGLGRAPGEENGNPLQYSSLENPMDRGARRATVHEVAKSQTRLSDEPQTHICNAGRGTYKSDNKEMVKKITAIMMNTKHLNSYSNKHFSNFILINIKLKRQKAKTVCI